MNRVVWGLSSSCHAMFIKLSFASHAIVIYATYNGRQCTKGKNR
ncbi:hypothetical protein [Moraxella cuniculi]|nr:hypothetical protein [Moraxella cuniculi]